MRRLFVRLLALALIGVSIALGFVALVRPYADNQRNWLVLGAVMAGLSAAALLLSGPLLGGAREFARSIRSEWSNGGT
jgi:hypothetical protein